MKGYIVFLSVVSLMLGVLQVVEMSHVSAQPFLTNPEVTPTEGEARETLFRFSVLYTNTAVPQPIRHSTPPMSPFSGPPRPGRYHVRISIDGEDDIHVVWMQWMPTLNWEICYVELDPTTNLPVWEDEYPDVEFIQISDDIFQDHSMYPGIVTDSENNAHVVWIDSRIELNEPPLADEIYYSKVKNWVSGDNPATALDLRVPDVPLSDLDGEHSGRAVLDPGLEDYVIDGREAAYIEHPDIDIDSDDDLHIVWSDGRLSADWEIFYESRTKDGVVLCNDMRISNLDADPDDGHNSQCPAICVGKGDRVHIVWQDNRDVEWEIYYQGQDKNCQNVVDDRIVSYGTGTTAPDDFNSAAPDIGAENGPGEDDDHVHIVWMDQRDEDPGHVEEGTHQWDPVLAQYYWEIYATSWDADGTPDSWGIIRRQSDMIHDWTVYGDYTGPSLGDGYSMYPRVAIEPSHWDAHRGTHITWHDDRDGNWNIYYTDVGNSCGNPDVDVRITDHPDKDVFPDIDLNSLKKFAILWSRFVTADGEWEIFKSHRRGCRQGQEDERIQITLTNGKNSAVCYMYRTDPTDTNAADGIEYASGGLLLEGDYLFDIFVQDSAGDTTTTGWTTGPTVYPHQMDFIRCDVTADSSIDILDGLHIIYWIGGMADPPPCEKAADGEDDEDVDLFDGLRCIYYLGGMAPPPPSPYPDCGPDPTHAHLTCDDFPPCEGKGGDIPTTTAVGSAEKSHLVVGEPVSEGGAIVVPVTLTSAEPLVGFSFVIEHDAALLTAVYVDNSGLITEAFDVFVGGVNEPGLVKVVAISDIEIANGVNKLPAGQHQVARIVFEANEKTLRRDLSLKVINSVMAVDHDRALNHQVVVKAAPRPTEFRLDQNYPNPFNPTTKIRYDLPVDCHVNLEIYNVLGQRVATLVNGDQLAGYHAVAWEGNDAASGIYVYRIQAGEFRATRKMVLMR